MQIETLKRSHVKRNILIAVVIVVILSAVILTFTKAKYRTTESMPLLNGTINYTLADLNIVEMYLNGEAIDALPDGNYELTEESYCTNEENVKDESITLSYDGSTKAFTVTPFNKKGTKCYLYFEEGASAGDTILASENAPTSSTTDWTGGTTYYYTGKPNNWVQFAGFWWRIIRINGDGSIRMIYQGTSANETGSETQIGSSQFNSDWEDNMYVGYMYQSGQLHGLQTSSTIKGVLDTWYINNIANKGFGEYVDGNAGFCGDRRTSSGSGTGTSSTDYQPYTRISNSSPSLSCEDADIYTTSGSNTGNKVLTQPIGLISADEAMFAGLLWMGSNQNCYLYTGQFYWTMSPYYYPNAFVFGVSSTGDLYLGSGRVDNSRGIRPVINLKSDISLTGSGSVDDPFLVVGAS